MTTIVVTVSGGMVQGADMTAGPVHEPVSVLVVDCDNEGEPDDVWLSEHSPLVHEKGKSLEDVCRSIVESYGKRLTDDQIESLQ